MKLWMRHSALILSLAAFCSLAPSRPQRAPDPAAGQDNKLPDGKSQHEEILKAEYEQNLKDAAQLVDLAEDLKSDLERNDRYVLSMATLKKTDDIEKLARRIRTRLRH